MAPIIAAALAHGLPANAGVAAAWAAGHAARWLDLCRGERVPISGGRRRGKIPNRPYIDVRRPV
jgi:hypothetical protein